MSHQSRRRRSYGRRQHELTERRERRDRYLRSQPEPEAPEEAPESNLSAAGFLFPSVRWAEGS